MAHSDAGHYSSKHKPGVSPDGKIAAAIREKGSKGEFACADAERITETLGVQMGEVGRTLDLLEIRIGRCQLGLFGYGPERKGISPAAAVAAELEDAIRGRLADGKLPCMCAWEIAKRLGIARMEVSSACETLNVRIKPCQLGAF